MARKLELTWHKKLKRWRKRYTLPDGKVKDFYFAFGTSKGDREGYNQALEAWKVKKAELEAEDKLPEISPTERVQQEIINLELLSRCYEQEEEHYFVGDCANRIAALKVMLLDHKEHGREIILTNEFTGTQHFNANGDLIREYGLQDYAIQEHEWEKYRDKIEELRGKCSVDNLISTQVQKLIDEKRQNVKLGDMTLASLDNYRVRLARFVDKYGDRSIYDINRELLLEYRNFIIDEIANKKIKKTTGSNIIKSVVQFVKHLAGAIDDFILPKILNTKDYGISVPTKNIDTFTTDEIKALLPSLTNRMKLVVLLGLNCGMYQGDIGELKHSQVDWKKGRIKRKRCKTEDIDSSPEVDYLLWGETFGLLKEFRSNDKEYVLLNARGGRIKEEGTNSKGNFTKKDCCGRAFQRLKVKLGLNKSLKHIRKTSATILGEHPNYKFYAQFFLSQAPREVIEKHYLVPNCKEFDEAVKWLGGKYGIE